MWRDSSRRVGVCELRVDGFDGRGGRDSQVMLLLVCLTLFLSFRLLSANRFNACA